jgi:hypothetical protein
MTPILRRFLSVANTKKLRGLCALWYRQRNSQRGISESKDLGSFEAIAAAILDLKMGVPGNGSSGKEGN